MHAGDAMTCECFAQVAPDVARGAQVEPVVLGTALLHAGACTGCRGRLAAERMLSAELEGLAARTASAQAPPHTEAVLLAAFRAARRPRQNRSYAGWWVTAAAVLLSAGLFLLKEEPRAEGPTVAVQPTPSAPRAGGGFVRVGFADPFSEHESVRVVRVEMPPQALLGFGVPLAEGTLRRATITADLMVGDDGTARAIRLVR